MKRRAFCLIIVSVCVILACEREPGPPKMGEPEVIAAFSPATATPITTEGVTPTEEGWRIVHEGARHVRLFEVENPDLANGVISYRAKMRAEALAGTAYLEMWVRIPGVGEFFSRALDQQLTGTMNWASVQTPFYLEADHKPDLLRLNVVLDGESGGSVGIRDAEVLFTPKK